MADKTIPQYTAAGSIDPVTDQFLLYQNSTNTYRKINRNTILGTTGTPLDTSSIQTVSNKILDNTNTITVRDGVFTIQDDVDLTKQARFQLSGITTATTRTYTLPNASSTIADISTPQTFTNKVLTSPTITGGSISNTTIAADAITGFTTATSGNIYGIPITLAKLPGASIANASITTTQIAVSTVAASNINFGGAGTGVWWEEIGRATLSVAGDTVSVTGIPSRKYLRIIYFYVTTTVIVPIIQFNNDLAANYSYRFSANGAADSTSVSQTSIVGGAGGVSNPQYGDFCVVNDAAQEKLIQGATATSVAGAANAPSRLEITGKWANTAAAISRVDLVNTGAGDFAIGSVVIVLGHN